MAEQNYIWQATVNNKIKYYFSTEQKAMEAIKRGGKILSHNAIDKSKQKINLIDDLGFKLNIILRKLKLD